MANKTSTRANEKDSAARKPQRGTRALRRQSEHVNAADALARTLNAPANTLAPADILGLQRTAGNHAVQRMLGAMVNQSGERSSVQTNPEGLPHSLKAGIESLSGMAMDDVKVHYNSSAPAGVQALAYTQGSDIHLGPGQEKHLAHEAWHVVQQRQGRVKPTLQTRGMAINDDVALEHEADTMGAKAVQVKSTMLQLKHGLVSSMLVPSLVQMKWMDIGNQQYEENETGEYYKPEKKSYRGTRYESNFKTIGLTDEQHEELMKIINADIGDEPAVEKVVEPPKGYTKFEEFKQAVYVDDKGLAMLDKIGRSHLVQGAHGKRGKGGWHQSGQISGATKEDFYLHPGSDPTLYLLKLDGVHKADGIQKITIAKVGKVNKGMHSF